MKILYCVTGSEFGGAVAHVLGLMQADIREGHTVGLVAAPEPRLMSEAREMGAHVFTNKYLVRRIQLHNDIQALSPVYHAVRKFNPDIVSAHSTKAGYAARLVCAILRKPVIFTAHGWPFEESRGWWKRRIFAIAERVASVTTARIICVSRYDLDLALKFKVAPAGKLVLIHNGVNPERFHGVDGTRVRREFGLSKELLVTMVSRLSPPKDVLTLLKACLRLRGNYRLMIVGDGELRDTAEEFTRKNGLGHIVIFAGEREDVPQFLAASDILVLSSESEGLPLVIIEAEMAGLPVVASCVGGVPELIENGVTGFTVPPRDMVALAEALQSLLDDVHLRRKFGSAARQKAIQAFTFENMLIKTYDIYESVINEVVRPAKWSSWRKTDVVV